MTEPCPIMTSPTRLALNILGGDDLRRVHAAALALNEIDAVGPGGSHLGRDYTRRHHRAFWRPSLLDRNAHARWQAAGASTLKERVHLQTAALREAPRAFVLEDSIRRRLDAALAAAGGAVR